MKQETQEIKEKQPIQDQGNSIQEKLERKEEFERELKERFERTVDNSSRESHRLTQREELILPFEDIIQISEKIRIFKQKSTRRLEEGDIILVGNASQETEERCNMIRY